MRQSLISQETELLQSFWQIVAEYFHETNWTSSLTQSQSHLNIYFIQLLTVNHRSDDLARFQKAIMYNDRGRPLGNHYYPSFIQFRFKKVFGRFSIEPIVFDCH